MSRFSIEGLEILISKIRAEGIEAMERKKEAKDSLTYDYYVKKAVLCKLLEAYLTEFSELLAKGEMWGWEKE